MSTVAAVIPTWNRAGLVRSVLVNLSSQTRPPDRVIVVDNGSTDDTKAVVREFGVECIALETNLGFAAAVNRGIQEAHDDWVLILNNDVALEPDWVERLMSAAAESGASFAVGKLLQPDKQNTLDGSWDLISRGAYAWRCGYQRADGPVWSTRRYIALAPMTAALFHRRVFEKVGLLETRFESYYEDVDFGIRCTLAGFTGVYEPAAVAVHLGKATYGKRAARVYLLSARNQVLLLAKHYPAQTLRRFAWPILVGQTLSLLAAARQGHPIAALSGKWQALKQWSGFRHQVSSSAAVEAAMLASEREILAIQRASGFDIYWRLYFSLVNAR
ncbi:MAG: glycosyltransferase family 2 protein [Acidobacteriaceae bacterium]|nr:glycosyltransferase family 2 protein [Acidobacteriaceae bacterium]